MANDPLIVAVTYDEGERRVDRHASRLNDSRSSRSLGGPRRKVEIAMLPNP
jgi:hypothetical protein